MLQSNGRVELEDEDEFEEACRRKLVGPDEATSAIDASEWIMRALRDRPDATVDLGLDPILAVSGVRPADS
ncbi:TPA: hypothetical protein DCE37_13390 [Candidatus Latescibacteria bacterium]|nr:hypothetical protein [Candidatus Latescibacterota bacterium]